MPYGRIFILIKCIFYVCSVIWMDVKHCRFSIRVTAFGCENGFAKVTAVDANSGI